MKNREKDELMKLEFENWYCTQNEELALAVKFLFTVNSLVHSLNGPSSYKNPSFLRYQHISSRFYS